MGKLKLKDENDQWLEAAANGYGVPSGGSQGDVLVKSSSTDYATEWQAPQTIKYIDITKTTDSNGFMTIIPSTDVPSGANVFAVFPVPPYPSAFSMFVKKFGLNNTSSTELTSYSVQIAQWNDTAYSNTSVNLRVYYY